MRTKELINKLKRYYKAYDKLILVSIGAVLLLILVGSTGQTKQLERTEKEILLQEQVKVLQAREIELEKEIESKKWTKDDISNLIKEIKKGNHFLAPSAYDYQITKLELELIDVKRELAQKENKGNQVQIEESFSLYDFTKWLWVCHQKQENSEKIKGCFDYHLGDSFYEALEKDYQYELDYQKNNK